MRSAGVALTFDDGPDPRWTSELLDLLAGAETRATFFLIAPRAAAAPEVVARMREEGHTIGLHCDQHVRHTDRGRTWVERDTDRALGQLCDLGVRPSLWRTPWGVCAPFTTHVASARDLSLVHWTVDTHDWRGDSAESMFAATSSALEFGAIVLAHDGIGPGALRTDPEQTLGYAALVVDWARHARIPLVAL